MSELAVACAGLLGTGAAGPVTPWLDPYRVPARAVALDIQAGASVAQALNNALRDAPVATAGGHPLQFVAQSELPEGEPYEACIARSGRVPTRDNAHDFYNGLVWLRFPQMKRRLNELHAAQIGARPVAARRGAARDVLTLFDENAALLQAPPTLARALTERDWNGLFTTHRADWADATLTVVGHALLEKLLRPRKAITAHVWLLGADEDLHDVTTRLLRPGPPLPGVKPWLPLPVLAVPGWCAANAQPGFYADPQVFRSATS